MELMLVSLAVLAGLELLVYTRFLWRAHQAAAIIDIVGLAIVSGALFMFQTNGWSYLVLIVALYRCFNLVRVAAGIADERYVRRAAFKTSWVLIVSETAAILIWLVSEHFENTSNKGWFLLGALQVVLAGVLALTLRRNLIRTLPPELDKHLSNNDLPTLTICVPARNETESLQHCLESLNTSDYPKLEVLVLDDCSQAGRTSEIIKSFAQTGVRFIKGQAPLDGWLAKNWAQQQLFEEANGQYVLFCGVDISFEPASLRNIVVATVLKQKRMVSLLPRNSLAAQQQWRSLLLQPMRYAWEMCLPRRLFNRPPVLSSCWLADRELLKHNGGFAAAKRSISPESHFARQAIITNGYSFWQSTAELAVHSSKQYCDQLSTAVRTRYPQLHRRPELVLFLSLVEMLLVLSSLPVAVVSVMCGHLALALLTAVAFGLSSYVYWQICRLTYRQVTWKAWLSLIPAVGVDLLLRNYSMYKYEFSEVIWKGRNICLPVMQVIKSLPRLPDIDK